MWWREFAGYAEIQNDIWPLDAKKLGRVASPMAAVEGGPSAAYEGASPTRVSRANYSHILHHEENFIKASSVRAESERRREEMQQQRERFKQRGQMLKAMREHSQSQIRSAKQNCHAEPP